MKNNGSVVPIVRIGQGGEVTPEELKHWELVYAGGSWFLGKFVPGSSGAAGEGTYNPCYLHELRVQPSGPGMQISRGVGILLFLVGAKSARLTPAAVIPLTDLLPAELEELAHLVNNAERERAQLRQQKTGVILPQVVPPSNLRG